MFHRNASDALAEATPDACQKLLAQGITNTVLVENRLGQWFLLHAYGKEHAKTLANSWVENLGARGASCREILRFGLGRSFHHMWEQPYD